MKKTTYIFLLVLNAFICHAQSDKIIYVTEKKHEFSSAPALDLFRLTLVGKNIFDGVVTFEIFTEKGKKIYNRAFTVYEMMERGPGDSRTEYDSTMIVIIMNQFFDEIMFSKPAFTDSADINDNFSDIATWNLIKQDADAISFSYLLGAEDGSRIAYSIKKKKVVVYFTCC